MKSEFHFQLQAYLDGELAEAQRRAVEARLQEDADGRALLAELRSTRALLAGQELPRPVPESREFYWSKIAQAIERPTGQCEPSPVAQPAWSRWIRFVLLPAGGLAALLVVFAASNLWFHPKTPAVAVAPHEVEITYPEAQMITFRDQQEHLTVVWLTYNK